MDAILLRKLTMKSCFAEGKFAGVPIGQLIQLGNTRYIRWVYYNQSSIDFMQEVKDEINITPEFEIKKPGTNFAMHEKLNQKMDSHMTNRMKKRHEKREKIKSEVKWNKSIDRTSKSVLQAINHGKIK